MKKLNNKGFGAIQIIFVIIVFVIVGGVGWYVYDKSSTKTTNTNTTTKEKDLQKQLNDANSELEKLKTKLAVSSPDTSKISPQCEGGNGGAVFGLINAEPVNGYVFYTVDCKSFMAKNEPKPHLAALKLNPDNTLTFAYSASSVDPFCINKDIIENSTEVSEAIGFPVCK